MVPIKVLQVITLSEMGGAQKVVYHLVAGLSPEEFEITVACAPGGELVSWLKRLSRKICVFEMPELKRDISPASDLKAFYKLYNFIKKRNFDIVHCHSSKAGILGRLAAFFAGVPKIYLPYMGGELTIIKAKWYVSYTSGRSDCPERLVQGLYVFLKATY